MHQVVEDEERPGQGRDLVPRRARGQVTNLGPEARFQGPVRVLQHVLRQPLVDLTLFLLGQQTRDLHLPQRPVAALPVVVPRFVEPPQAIRACGELAEQELTCLLPRGRVPVPVVTVGCSWKLRSAACAVLGRSAGVAQFDGRAHRAFRLGHRSCERLDPRFDPCLVGGAHEHDVRPSPEGGEQRAQYVTPRARVGRVHSGQIAAVECEHGFVVNDRPDQHEGTLSPGLGQAPRPGLHDFRGGDCYGGDVEDLLARVPDRRGRPLPTAAVHHRRALPCVPAQVERPGARALRGRGGQRQDVCRTGAENAQSTTLSRNHRILPCSAP